MKSPRFFLDQDSSCHWYIIPEAKRQEWEAWAALPEDDPNGWHEPEWAHMIDGVSQITFTDPIG